VTGPLCTRHLQHAKPFVCGLRPTVQNLRAGQSLEACRRLLGSEHPDTLMAMNNLALTLNAQGDLAGERKLGEQVLEGRRRLLGDHHPDTTVSAWDLLQTLLESRDTDAAGRVWAENLRWLLDSDPATLAGDQQKIRQWLSEMREKGRPQSKRSKTHWWKFW
jgi:hypothetical protein